MPLLIGAFMLSLIRFVKKERTREECMAVSDGK